MDTAWRLASECIRSDIVLLFPPFMIALACLHAACALVCNTCSHREWFAELSVDYDNILEITKMICHNFEHLWRPFDNSSSEIVQLITTKVPKPRTNNTPSSQSQSSHGHHNHGGHSQQQHGHHGHHPPQQQQQHHLNQHGQQQQRNMVNELFA